MRSSYVVDMVVEVWWRIEILGVGGSKNERLRRREVEWRNWLSDGNFRVVDVRKQLTYRP
jgi:hypothetical protein